MKCPKCGHEFETDEEDKVIMNMNKYDELIRFACIGEVALSRVKK